MEPTSSLDLAMTTLQLIDLTCPVCTTQFRSQAVLATNAFGGKRTDFHERAAGMQPLPYFVHLCCTCGYAGVDRDFDHEVDLSAETREKVWFTLPSSLAREGPRGSLKYEHAALVASWQGCEPRYLGDLYLRAAWCCVDEQDHEAERFYRRHAAWQFAEALRLFDGVDRSERAVITYLIGELWRRVGDEDMASSWFDRVPLEIVEPSTQEWVLDVTRQQRQTPREWFG
jgi:uncharacterized protein (DUF2225 family)